MLNLMKILSALMLARSAPVKINLVKQLLSGAAMIAGICLMIAILAGSFVMGGVYYGYTLLIEGGYSQGSALAITACTLLVLIAGLVRMAAVKIRELNELPHLFAQAEAPIGHKVHSIAESFLDGLLKRKTETTR